jgi:hypothetical protein
MVSAGENVMKRDELGHPLPIIDLMIQFVKASGQQWPFD